MAEFLDNQARMWGRDNPLTRLPAFTGYQGVPLSGPGGSPPTLGSLVEQATASLRMPQGGSGGPAFTMTSAPPPPRELKTVLPDVRMPPQGRPPRLPGQSTSAYLDQLLGPDPAAPRVNVNQRLNDLLGRGTRLPPNIGMGAGMGPAPSQLVEPRIVEGFGSLGPEAPMSPARASTSSPWSKLRGGPGQPGFNPSRFGADLGARMAAGAGTAAPVAQAAPSAATRALPWLGRGAGALGTALTGYNLYQNANNPDTLLGGSMRRLEQPAPGQDYRTTMADAAGAAAGVLGTVFPTAGSGIASVLGAGARDRDRFHRDMDAGRYGAAVGDFGRAAMSTGGAMVGSVVDPVRSFFSSMPRQPEGPPMPTMAGALGQRPQLERDGPSMDAAPSPTTSQPATARNAADQRYERYLRNADRTFNRAGVQYEIGGPTPDSEYRQVRAPASAGGTATPGGPSTGAIRVWKGTTPYDYSTNDRGYVISGPTTEEQQVARDFAGQKLRTDLQKAMWAADARRHPMEEQNTVMAKRLDADYAMRLQQLAQSGLDAKTIQLEREKISSDWRRSRAALRAGINYSGTELPVLDNGE